MKVGLRTTYGPRVEGTGRWYSCDKVAAVSRQEEIIADNAHLGTLPHTRGAHTAGNQPPRSRVEDPY